MSESTPIFYPKAALEQWLGKKAQQHSYSLEEFGELIKPTYQVYEEYIRRCVAGYKCLHYCRYADDFIISVIGSRRDAEQIKADVGDLLAKALKLELSEKKTKVTHSSDFARFL